MKRSNILLAAVITGLLTLTSATPAVAVPASMLGTAIYTPGDSITAGSALPDPAAEAWPTQFAVLTQGAVATHNVAHGGQCLAYTLGFCSLQPRLVDTFASQVLDASPRPSLVIVEIGHNDLTHLTDAQYKAAYLDLQRAAGQAHVRVMFATIPPIAAWNGLYRIAEKQRLRINAWLRSTLGPRGYVDFDWALRERGHTSLNPALDAGDGIHPNAAGETRMAWAMLRVYDLMTMRTVQAVPTYRS